MTNHRNRRTGDRSDRIIKDPAAMTTEESQTITLTALALLEATIGGPDHAKIAELLRNSLDDPFDMSAINGAMADITLATLRSSVGFGDDRLRQAVETLRQATLNGHLA